MSDSQDGHAPSPTSSASYSCSAELTMLRPVYMGVHKDIGIIVAPSSKHETVPNHWDLTSRSTERVPSSAVVRQCL